MDNILSLVTADRIVSLIIILGCVWAALAISKAVLRVALTTVAVLATINFLDPSLFYLGICKIRWFFVRKKVVAQKLSYKIGWYSVECRLFLCYTT